MNHRWLVVFVLTCVMSIAMSAQTKDSDEIVQLVKRYDQAWNKKDSAAVDEILAADYIYLSSTGTTSSRRETLELLKSLGYKLTFAQRSEIKTIQMGGTVVVSSRWKGKGTYNGQQINDDQRCSLVFAKQERDWRLLAEHCTQITGK